MLIRKTYQPSIWAAAPGSHATAITVATRADARPAVTSGTARSRSVQTVAASPPLVLPGKTVWIGPPVTVTELGIWTAAKTSPAAVHTAAPRRETAPEMLIMTAVIVAEMIKAPAAQTSRSTAAASARPCRPAGTPTAWPPATAHAANTAAGPVVVPRRDRVRHTTPATARGSAQASHGSQGSHGRQPALNTPS